MVVPSLHACLRGLLVATFGWGLTLGSAPVFAQTEELQTVLVGQSPTIALPLPQGVDGSALAWKASVGTATPSAGAASFELPKATIPQVAIVAAYDSTTRTPIVRRVLLIGTPTVEIRSEPNVKVTVGLGERTFGPVSTDNKGLARLKIEAAPGVASVKTFATDSYGNVTEGQLALDPPPFPRVLVLCAATEEAAYVIEVTEQGDFAATPSFATKVSEGDVQPIETVSPGIFRLPLRVQNATKDWKTVSVEAKLAGFTDSCSFKVSPPPPSEPFKLKGTVTPVEPQFTLFVGAGAGFATNFGLLSGPWVNLTGSYPLSSTRDGLRIELAVGYTHANNKVSTDDGQDLELTVDSIPLLLGPRYVLAWGLVHVSAGAHAGISFTSESLVGPLTDQATNTTPLWFGGDVGVAYWIGSGDVGIDVGYSYAPINQDDISGNVAGLRATLQYERGF